MKLFGRLLLLPFKLVLASFETVFRLGRVVGSVPVRVSRGTGRILGFRGMVGLALGVAAGLLLAPVPGRELRARLVALWRAREGVGDAELADRVGFELEHAPRTWHLPQPEVAVADGRVVLRGVVSMASARDELARVAGAVPGVAAVENLVTVSDGAESGDAEGAEVE